MNTFSHINVKINTFSSFENLITVFILFNMRKGVINHGNMSIR